MRSQEGQGWSHHLSLDSPWPSSTFRPAAGTLEPGELLAAAGSALVMTPRPLGTTPAAAALTAEVIRLQLARYRGRPRPLQCGSGSPVSEESQHAAAYGGRVIPGAQPATNPHHDTRRRRTHATYMQNSTSTERQRRWADCRDLASCACEPPTSHHFLRSSLSLGHEMTCTRAHAGAGPPV
ncbi:hypothetical protein LZ30DRAFT_715870 [Colletotrichum cereale]|nr:hypothetical protein LZ30DRAFT_715870 [Colletotrichum cereale]